MRFCYALILLFFFFLTQRHFQLFLLKFWTYSRVSAPRQNEKHATDKGKSASRWLQTVFKAQLIGSYIFPHFLVKYTVNSLLEQLPIQDRTSAGMSLTFPLINLCRRPIRKAKLNRTVANSARLCTIFQRAEWDLFEEMQINSHAGSNLFGQQSLCDRRCSVIRF